MPPFAIPQTAQLPSVHSEKPHRGEPGRGFAAVYQLASVIQQRNRESDRIIALATTVRNGILSHFVGVQAPASRHQPVRHGQHELPAQGSKIGFRDQWKRKPLIMKLLLPPPRYGRRAAGVRELPFLEFSPIRTLSTS